MFGKNLFDNDGNQQFNSVPILPHVHFFKIRAHFFFAKKETRVPFHLGFFATAVSYTITFELSQNPSRITQRNINQLSLGNIVQKLKILSKPALAVNQQTLFIDLQHFIS